MKNKIFQSKTFHLPPSTSGGFVVLFAVLISTIILLVVAGIFSISLKETILSSSAREAERAFFAADSGIECALYWDIGTASAFDLGTPIRCNDENILVGGAGSTFSPFLFDAQFADDTCAKVSLKRNVVIPDKNGVPLSYTEVIARGFNKCNGPQPVPQDPLLVERVIRVRYGSGTSGPVSAPTGGGGPTVLPGPTGGPIGPVGSPIGIPQGNPSGPIGPIGSPLGSTGSPIQ